MFRRISSSLSAKVFLLIAAMLATSCVALYLVVALAVPGGYRALATARAEAAVAGLADELSRADAKEAATIIAAFCAERGAAATLSGSRGAAETSPSVATSDSSVGSGEEASGTGAEQPQEPAYTVTAAVELADGSAALLTVTDASGSLSVVADTLTRLFPPALLLIVVVAALGAWVCTRLVARPVVEIADVSSRLARLDMTWSCDERRRDEVGVLGRSLNSMAARLKGTFDDLTRANDRLRVEADEANARARRRRDFLAAASHELKTPLAVVRTQAEGMLLGIGDFSDHEAHLPRLLSAVDRMDALVREMLDAARADGPSSGGVRVVDARDALARAVDAARDVATRRGVDILFADGSPCLVHADPALLGIALDNVAMNATRHSLPGTVASVALDEGRLTVTNRCEPLSPDVVARLSEPFFRPDGARSRSDGGSGLGLYLVARALGRLGVPYEMSCEGGEFVFSADFGGILAP